MYVFYFYLAACGPKGHGSGLLLPSRTAEIIILPLNDRIPPPTTMGYTGASLSPTTLSRLTNER